MRGSHAAAATHTSTDPAAASTNRLEMLRDASRRFDPLDSEYMRAEFSELCDLRREEAALSAQLDRLGAHEEALERRIAEVRGRRSGGAGGGMVSAGLFHTRER